MAKLALIFVIVSLFALCMAARIPREEPTTVNRLQEIISKFQAAWTPEQQEVYNNLVKQVAEQAQQISKTLNESIQKLGEQGNKSS